MAAEMLEYRVDGAARRCPVWLPPDFTSDRRWPLVVFLHAYEERGDDGEHLVVGIGPALESEPGMFPCIVLLPQCPQGHVWSVVDRPWAEGMSGAEHHIDAAIDAVLGHYPVDATKIALTGASMGGYGVFGYGAERAERFHALAPICGGGDMGRAEVLTRTPLWAVHGSDDDVVPADESRRMITAITAAGGTRHRYTEVEGAGHDVWDVAYRDPSFLRFLSSGTLPR
ncbi:MAG: dienelactone hydrolase family protein [Planctomycetes bacterium]|nr:dienelactone hydrolase family protein [Planctomycetota bacterium]